MNRTINKKIIKNHQKRTILFGKVENEDMGIVSYDISFTY